MQLAMLRDIQLSDIELFLDVVKFGSFSRAAVKAHMSQPWVSKRIALLERELGVTLFNRSRRPLQPTPAGRILATRFNELGVQLEDAVYQARETQGEAAGSLRLGFMEWGGTAFLGVPRAFTAAHSHINVDISRMGLGDLHKALAEGSLDAVCMASYDCAELAAAGYHVHPVRTVPLMAYMGSGNPLAGRKGIAFEELQGEPLLMIDSKSSSGHEGFVRNLLARHGITPGPIRYAHDYSEHVGNLLLDKGLLIAGGYFLENVLEEQIARVPLRDETDFVCVIWGEGNRNPALDCYLQEAILGLDA